MVANPPITAADHGPILDKDNIINVRDGESLYQICLKLRRRLSGVPGFRPYIEELEEREADGVDPVSSLWQCFRSGVPLLTIYNASQPEEGDLMVDYSQPDKVPKKAAFLFIKSCMQQMKIPPSDTFTLTDLYSDNTTGFVKVTKLINRVLDLLYMSGHLHPSTDSEDSRDGVESTTSSSGQAPRSMTRRQHILRELVMTERQYVHHLQNLQALKKELEEVGALAGDSIHNIFLNLNNLLDFAQRFLIRVEQQYELPEDQQTWGQLFIHYREPFKQYEPFIANQKKCEVTCQQEWEKMVSTARSTLTKQMLANPTILYGFLLKPFQRLTKYPLLLKDLQNQTQDEDLKADLSDAIAIIQEVLMQADASIDQETRDDALQDLRERIDDWKSLSLEALGELLLLGTFNVMKEGGLRSDDKEYHIYLFSRILIMCKDINANKPKNRLANNRPVLSLRGKPKMNLKGRIYFTNVTQVSRNSAPGNYQLTISWRGDQTIETFIIKFKNDDTLQKWHNLIQTQRSSCIMEVQQAASNNTPNDRLHSLANLNIRNPYTLEPDEEEDNSRFSEVTLGDSITTPYSDYSMSRNASNNSLRSRSTTTGSGSSNPHNSAGRMRLAINDMGGLPQLNTRITGLSPMETTNQSYFSPIERDSTPVSASTRSSAQSTTFSGYHRGTPHVNGHYTSGREDSYRNTAPAMGRNVSGQGLPYMVSGRTSGGKPPVHGALAQANRARSASSPDIHPNVQHNRKYTTEEHAPTVPPIPAHVAKHMAPPNRSQNNSPINNYPARGASNHYAAQPYSRSALTHNTFMAPDQSRPRGHGPSLSSSGRPMSPPTSTTPPITALPVEHDPSIPNQLKAKVCFSDNYVSMIIPSTISFRSLTERIDAKLSKFTSHSITSGSVRLRYRDEEGDFILIESDEDVQNALEEWRERHSSSPGQSQNNELLLYAAAIGEH